MKKHEKRHEKSKSKFKPVTYVLSRAPEMSSPKASVGKRDVGSFSTQPELPGHLIDHPYSVRFEGFTDPSQFRPSSSHTRTKDQPGLDADLRPRDFDQLPPLYSPEQLFPTQERMSALPPSRGMSTTNVSGPATNRNGTNGSAVEDSSALERYLSDMPGAWHE